MSEEEIRASERKLIANGIRRSANEFKMVAAKNGWDCEHDVKALMGIAECVEIGRYSMDPSKWVKE